jgi:N-acetylmuramoyl-L-alanine amidase
MAFITNREDEYLLNNNDFQGKIAKTLNATIKKYFER